MCIFKRLYNSLRTFDTFLFLPNLKQASEPWRIRRSDARHETRTVAIEHFANILFTRYVCVAKSRFPHTKGHNEVISTMGSRVSSAKIDKNETSLFSVHSDDTCLGSHYAKLCVFSVNPMTNALGMKEVIQKHTYDNQSRQSCRGLLTDCVYIRKDPIICDFESGLCGWTDASNNTAAIDWRLEAAGGGDSKPDTDHTCGNRVRVNQQSNCAKSIDEFCNAGLPLPEFQGHQKPLWRVWFCE